MLDPDAIADLLRAAEYFASRPYARIGRDVERARRLSTERKRLHRRKVRNALASARCPTAGPAT